MRESPLPSSGSCVCKTFPKVESSTTYFRGIMVSVVSERVERPPPKRPSSVHAGRSFYAVKGAYMEPILEFQDDAQAVESLREWQHRLYLDDWIIKILLVPRYEIEGSQGMTEFLQELRSAVIRIAIPDDDMRGRIVKVCHEQTLVHELLHLKYNWVESSGTYEGKYTDSCEHALLEQMARSLIMAKYGIGPEWFRNF